MEKLQTNELFLTKKHVTNNEWQTFFDVVSKYNGLLSNFKIILCFSENKINYYVETKCSLPSVVNGLPSFILRETEIEIPKENKSIFYHAELNSNIIDIKNKLEISNKGHLKYAVITIKRNLNKLKYKTKLVMEKNNTLVGYNLIFNVPSTILSVDFNENYNLVYKSAPKYLDINKCINVLNNNHVSSLVKVDTFPYLQGSYYLDLNNYNFAVHSAIFGSSGSGKSTLLHILGGLDTPTEGSVEIAGRELSKMNDNELTIFRRRQIGFVFQSYNLLPILNAYENIVLPIELDGNKADYNFIMKIVKMIGMETKMDRMPNQLSGGEQQRIAIARALASKPSILLADEPTGNLDSRTSQDVIGLLKNIKEHFHQTILMITHNEAIAQLAETILCIEDGKIVESRWN